MQVQLTLKSSNVKTGPIPVSTTSAASCPAACPLRGPGGCYAASGPVALHWQAVTRGERGMDWKAFCKAIATLPDGQLWRHNQAGDLPGENDVIDQYKLHQLVHANAGRHGFTYTHYPMLGTNIAEVQYANRHGFTINLSANDPAHADALADLQTGAPIVTILPHDQLTNCTTPAGRKIVVCPAVTHDNVSCATCQLCSRADRKVIIGFPAHGAKKKVISLKLAKD